MQAMLSRERADSIELGSLLFHCRGPFRREGKMRYKYLEKVIGMEE